MRGESRYRALAVGDYEGGRPETVDSNFDRQIRGGGPWGGVGVVELGVGR